MPRAMWSRDPNWPSDVPWRRNEYFEAPEDDPEHYIHVEQGGRAIDIRGFEVSVGDRIAVAVTVSRSANMRVGKVISIDEIMVDSYTDEDGNWIRKARKVGSGRLKITCEWETSGWDRSVQKSSIEAGLPKYIKL